MNTAYKKSLVESYMFDKSCAYPLIEDKHATSTVLGGGVESFINRHKTLGVPASLILFNESKSLHKQVFDPENLQDNDVISEDMYSKFFFMKGGNKKKSYTRKSRDPTN